MDEIFFQSKLDILIDVPLTASLNHQLYFNSTQERDSYFNSKVRPDKSWTDFKYIRDNNNIKVQGTETEFYHASYMRFRNEETEGMWIYAFIIKVEYINRNTTNLIFKIDSWQTYFNSLVIKDCDITREHVASPNNWKNYTQPEEINKGEYVIVFDSPIRSITYDGVLIISTIDLIRSGGTIDNPKIESAVGGIYNGLPSACALYYTESLENLCLALSSYPWVTQGIIGVYAIGKEMINGSINMTTSNMGFTIGVISTSLSPQSMLFGFNLTEYLPNVNNKKLWTYPYTYIEVCTASGSKYILKPELLSGDKVEVSTVITLVPSPNVFLNTEGYIHAPNSDAYLASTVFNGFPSFPCLNNMYITTKEQARSMEALVSSQNIEKIDGALFGTAVGGTITALSGDLTGSISQLLGGIGNAAQGYFNEADRAARSRLAINQKTGAPSLVGGSSPGACPALFATDQMDPRVRIYTLKEEDRNIIDQYFTCYGYCVNRIGSPVLSANGRRFRYIKCNHVNIFGNIPQQNLEEIRGMFISGLTLWYDYANVGVY